ncbi:MAG: glycosyltransferase family 39 protein [Actinomycetota bacterium]|nr:glycosyltransferase family 39 protein [Actinomycetota bacterium]
MRLALGGIVPIGAVDGLRRRASLTRWQWPRERAVVVGLVILGAILRFSTLGVQSYWYDELATVQIVQPPLHDAVHAYINSESTPPLYYLTGWVWGHVFGEREYALRALSAAYGSAAVFLTYLAGRRLVSSRVGVLAAALVAFNPMLVWYSQEARAYSLAVLLAAASLVSMLGALRVPTARNVALWTVVAALALLTHYYAVFVIGGETVVLLTAYRRGGRWRQLLPVLALPAVALGLLALARAQGGGSRTNWIASIPLGHRVATVGKELISANTLLIDDRAGPPGGALGYLVALAILLGASCAAVAWRRQRKVSRSALPLALGAGTLLLPLLLVVAHQDYFFDRNLVMAWIPLAIALAAGLAILPRVAAVGLVALICLVGIAINLDVARWPELQRDDWRDAVTALGHSTAGRAVIVIPPYARGMVPFYGVPSSPIPTLGIQVRQLFVIGYVNAASGPNPKIAGFHTTRRTQVQHLGVFDLATSHPITLTPAWAQANGIDPNEIMAAYTPRAYAWLTTYIRQATTWQQALTRLSQAATQGRLDPAAEAMLTQAPSADESLLPPPQDVPHARALALAMMRTADLGAVWASSLSRLGRAHTPTVTSAALHSGERFDLAFQALPGAPHDRSATTITRMVSTHTQR